ncbi:PAS domain-containing protein [Mycobacterium sp. B14F4]|uniref:PAS domain-containing protein n=1 Tax=Mycobacterium sp. B14F4 TaxID=3153565 RepID=UPI00325C62AD
MTHDWLLVETLGSEPVVVAQGHRTRNLVPISAFLRRNPHLMAIQTAIGETVRGGQGLSSITPKNDRVIRTEVVQMTDGRIHGVHVWIGPPDMEPPERPVPGPLIWDLDSGIATDTPEALRNSGWDPKHEPTRNRTFADDLPTRELNPNEAKVLAMAIKREPGTTLCSSWDVSDYRGEPITVGFVARTVSEPADDGTERLLCRAMNWRGEPEGPTSARDQLAQRILDGLAQPGVHRALVDLSNWTLLKWLDDPAPFFDWRASLAGEHVVQPADRPEMARMADDFATGTASGVLRMPSGRDGGWAPVHVTVNRVELDDDVYAGLATLRRPTADELSSAGFDTAGQLPEPSEAGEH